MTIEEAILSSYIDAVMDKMVLYAMAVLKDVDTRSLQGKEPMDFVQECTKLHPPTDSVAAEYIENEYAFLYKFEEKAQQINKSTWFQLNQYDNDDTIYYEYCIPTKQYQTVLSIIWED